MVITTGSEVNSGRIRDGFGRVIRKKIAPFGGRWMGQIIVPDNSDLIAAEIQNALAEGAQLILVTGGMSVDADDATPQGIRARGPKWFPMGSGLTGFPVMLAYQGHVAICAFPVRPCSAARLHWTFCCPASSPGKGLIKLIWLHWPTGACENCPDCYFPHCAFGKNSCL